MTAPVTTAPQQTPAKRSKSGWRAGMQERAA
jgi:hypothetical protein